MKKNHSQPSQTSPPINAKTVRDKVYTNLQIIKRAFAYPLQYPLHLAVLYASILASSMLNTYLPGLGEQFIYLLSKENASETIVPADCHDKFFL